MDKITDDLKREGLKISGPQGQTLKLSSNLSSFDPDLSREIITFDNHKTIYAAFNWGRGGTLYQNLITQIKLLAAGQSFPAAFTLDESAINTLLRQQFYSLEKPLQNARPEITWPDDSYQIKILGEASGLSLNYDQIITDIKNRLTNLDNQSIIVKLENQPAQITALEVQDKNHLIDKVLATTTPTLTYQNSSWNLGRRELSSMLAFQKDDEIITLGLQPELFVSWLEKNVAPEVNTEPRDASMEMKDGRVISLSVHHNGQKINVESTLEAINQSLFSENKKVELVVDITKPKIITEEINNLGIKEIIGIGQSNFKGSPVNRRHNIRNGANKLHGVLIKPGEEFSLINALGAIDDTTGYLPELVIKENRTTPEFGGGLCQIGTTVFRAAMASGLPITERRNHSYSVTYYLEDGLPGIDATIYIPHPDVRFINDTGRHILIQTNISGDNLYFEFWGTSDGRASQRSKPKVWGWVSPAPTKYIETLELKPGAKKCTEVSHRGVNASFVYTVTYPGGEKKETTFTSHYKPWQAVCLIGVEKLSDTNGNGSTTTSTTPLTP